MTCLPLCQDQATNFNAILQQMLRTWRMGLCGGMSDAQCFYAYHTWPVITLQFLVSTWSSCIYLRCWILCHIATTVNVECVFSHRHLILLHIYGCLAVESTHVSICIGLWSIEGLVYGGDIKASLSADKIKEKGKLPIDWDTIHAS